MLLKTHCRFLAAIETRNNKSDFEAAQLLTITAQLALTTLHCYADLPVETPFYGALLTQEGKVAVLKYYFSSSTDESGCIVAFNIDKHGVYSDFCEPAAIALDSAIHLRVAISRHMRPAPRFPFDNKFLPCPDGVTQEEWSQAKPQS